MRVFLDANVLFTAAHKPIEKAALVIELVAWGCWRLFSIAYAFEEARRNPERKFPEHLPAFHAFRPFFDLNRSPVREVVLGGLVAKDQPIFQAALDV